MTERLASIRPPRAAARCCLPANLVSRRAATLISFWPVSQPHIDFYETWSWCEVGGPLFDLPRRHRSVGRRRLLSSSSQIASCWSDLENKKELLSLWVTRPLNSGLLTLLCTLALLALTDFPPHLSNLPPPQLLFPLLLSRTVRSLRLALCVDTGGYEMAGRLLETVVSV